jgi:hypothetical protein
MTRLLRSKHIGSQRAEILVRESQLDPEHDEGLAEQAVQLAAVRQKLYTEYLDGACVAPDIEQPLALPGLTWAQRLNYFVGITTYFEGWQKAIFYAMPILYFATGILPIDVPPGEFLLRLIPYLVLVVATFELLSRGTGYLLISERYTMLRFWTYMLTITALFTRKPLKFNVTPKGKTDVPAKVYMPQLVVLGLSIAAPIWATLAHWQGWIDYGGAWGGIAFWASMVWIVWNSYFALYVVRHSLQMRQERDDFRFLAQMPLRVEAQMKSGSESWPALAFDLNPGGLGFRSTEPLEPGTLVSLELPLAAGPVRAEGEVRHVAGQATDLGTVFNHGVQFRELAPAVRDAIQLHCTHHALPVWRQQNRQSLDIMTRLGEVMRNARGERRKAISVPAEVRIAGGDESEAGPRLVILEEVSARGARLVSERMLEPGTSLTLSVPGRNGAPLTGIVRHVRALETSLGVSFVMGVEFSKSVAHEVRDRTSVLIPGWRVSPVQADAESA